MKPGPKGPSKWTAEVINGEIAERLLAFFERPESLFLEAFCVEQGFPREYLARWNSDENPVFRDALAMANTIQAARLLEQAVRSQLNARVACLILQAKHGFSTKSEVTVHEPQDDYESKARAATEALMAAKPADPQKAREWLAEIQQNGEEVAREAAQRAMELVDMMATATSLNTAIIDG